MSTMFERITHPSGICDSCRSAGRTLLPGPAGDIPVSKYWVDRQDGKPFAAQICSTPTAIISTERPGGSYEQRV